MNTSGTSYEEHSVVSVNEAKKCMIAAELNQRLDNKDYIDAVASKSDDIRYLKKLRSETLPRMFANLTSFRRLEHYICVAHLLETCLDIIFSLDEPFSEAFLSDLQLRISDLREKIENVYPSVECDYDKTGIDSTCPKIKLENRSNYVCVKTEPDLDGGEVRCGVVVQVSAEQADCPATVYRPETRPLYFPGDDRRKSLIPVSVENQIAIEKNNVSSVSMEISIMPDEQLPCTLLIQLSESLLKASHPTHPILHSELTNSNDTRLSRRDSLSHVRSSSSNPDKRRHSYERNCGTPRKLSRFEAPKLPLSVEVLNNDTPNEVGVASSSSGMMRRSRSFHVRSVARFQTSHPRRPLNTFDPGLGTLGSVYPPLPVSVMNQNQDMEQSTAGESPGQQEGEGIPFHCDKEDARIPEFVANATVD